MAYASDTDDSDFEDILLFSMMMDEEEEEILMLHMENNLRIARSVKANPRSSYSVTIDAGKRYSQTVEQGFQLSMAALENKTGSKEFVQVMLQHESSEYLLCTLQHGNLLQQPLNLAFAAGEQVSFSLNGSGVIHLTGYLVPEEDESDFGDEFSESEEDAPELVSAQELTGKRKASPAIKKSKKIKLLNDTGEDDSEDEDDDSDDDEEEEDFSDDFDDSYFDGQDSEDDEVDDEGEEDDDEEEEEEMEVTIKKQKKTVTTPQPKQNKQTEQKTPQANNKKTPKENKSASSKKTQSTNASETPKKLNTTESETPSTPNGEDSSSKKKKKKKKKKNKNNDTENSSMNESKTETPSSTPTQKTPSSTPTQSATKKKVVGGGTLVEDLKIGNGPEAKPGKMVSVYYVGTLAKNNKRFDSCTGGKPFRFRLNQGEVIKGWDNGVAGMKVGGKRRLTVPASQGYGNTKQGPIPPNSTLTFEVELKAVS